MTFQIVLIPDEDKSVFDAGIWTDPDAALAAGLDRAKTYREQDVEVVVITRETREAVRNDWFRQ